MSEASLGITAPQSCSFKLGRIIAAWNVSLNDGHLIYLFGRSKLVLAIDHSYFCKIDRGFALVTTVITDPKDIFPPDKACIA